MAENGVTLSSPRIGNRFCALRLSPEAPDAGKWRAALEFTLAESRLSRGLLQIERLTGEVQRLRSDVTYRDPKISSYRLGNIIGNSPKAREIVTIIGANGAGKSTTLKTLSGQIQPREGTVEFDGNRYYLDWNRPESIGKAAPFYGVAAVAVVGTVRPASSRKCCESRLRATWVRARITTRPRPVR